MDGLDAESRSLFRLGFDSIALVEAVDSSRSVHELLFARVERMARRTDFNVDVLYGRASFDDVAANASDFRERVLRMDSLFHNSSDILPERVEHRKAQAQTASTKFVSMQAL